VALTLSHYRFGIDELAENTHGWYAAEDTSPAVGVAGIPLDTTFLLRFCVQANATGLANVDNEFQYRVNGGTWTNITTTSTVVRAVAAVALTNGGNCTKRLSGTGTFETTGAGQTEDGTSGGTANDIVASGNSETECGLTLRSVDIAGGDVIEFRLTRDGGVLLDAYAVVPTLTVPNAYTIVAVAGSYVYTGQDAGLRFGRVLAAAAGAYALVGNTADLTYTPAVADVLTADSGAYVVAGQPAELRFDRRMLGTAGGYVVAGSDAGLLLNRRVVADPGAYVYVGQAAEMARGTSIVAAPGAYVVAGSDVQVTRTYVLGADAGAYVVAGSAAALVYTTPTAYVLTAGGGVYAIAGGAAQLTYSGGTPIIDSYRGAGPQDDPLGDELAAMWWSGWVPRSGPMVERKGEPEEEPETWEQAQTRRGSATTRLQMVAAGVSVVAAIQKLRE
jgi:hypothetical protein